MISISNCIIFKFVHDQMLKIVLTHLDLAIQCSREIYLATKLQIAKLWLSMRAQVVGEFSFAVCQIT